MISLTSFGYGHPVAPPVAHFTLDARHLFRDPHVDPAMRQMTGLDQAVVDSVMRQPGAVTTVLGLASLILGLAETSGDVILAIGCVGGRHRSVVLINEVAKVIRSLDAGHPMLAVTHRDIDRPVIVR